MSQQVIEPEDLYARLNAKWPFKLYNPSYEKYVFVSNNTDAGDNYVDLHKYADEKRNFFVPYSLGGKRYRLYSESYRKWMFGSNTTAGPDNVVEMHNHSDRNEWEIEVVTNKVNTVTLKHVHLHKFAFCSNDTDAGDNMLEAHSYVEDRNNFQLVFGNSKSTVLTDINYDLDRATLQTMPPVTLASYIAQNEQDVDNSEDHDFSYT